MDPQSVQLLPVKPRQQSSEQQGGREPDRGGEEESLGGV